MSAQDFSLNVSAYDPGTFNQGNVFERIGDWFNGRDRAAEYNAKAAALDKKYEQDNLAAARGWAEYMDSTQVQRRVKDIEAAGLNPWLAVQNGLSTSAGQSVGEGGSAKNYNKAKNGDNPLKAITKFYKEMMNFQLKAAEVLADFAS